MNVVLSHYQVTPVLQARRAGAVNATMSTDLGITTTRVRLSDTGIEFGDGQELLWQAAERVVKDENACFVLQAGGVRKIQTFSELTSRPLSLYPTRGAPTMLVAGFPMHRIKDSDPYQDTLTKVKTLAPVKGHVLDTATGLGYTAIELARTAARVVTIELDPAAQEIARQNPWSRALFEHATIEQRIGDAFEVAPTLGSRVFDAVLHDPPTLALAGDLYSLEFYQELFRVLRAGGKLFHYIGDPDSRFGANVTRGVIERLQAAGFTRIARRAEAFGVTAVKGIGAAGRRPVPR